MQPADTRVRSSARDRVDALCRHRMGPGPGRERHDRPSGGRRGAARRAALGGPPERCSPRDGSQLRRRRADLRWSRDRDDPAEGNRARRRARDGHRAGRSHDRRAAAPRLSPPAGWSQWCPVRSTSPSAGRSRATSTARITAPQGRSGRTSRRSRCSGRMASSSSFARDDRRTVRGDARRNGPDGHHHRRAGQAHPDPRRDGVGRHRPGPLAGRRARGTRGARRTAPGRVARPAVARGRDGEW